MKNKAMEYGEMAKRATGVGGSSSLKPNIIYEKKCKEMVKGERSQVPYVSPTVRHANVRISSVCDSPPHFCQQT
ncbi:hypothetical protein LguiA_021395 [Lonicera macranthoides]